MKQKISLVLATLLMFVYITPISAEEITPMLESEAVILIEESTGKVLYEKNSDQIMYPASTSKVLTALIALENGDPDDIIVVGNEVNAVPLDASKAGHVSGDKLTLRQLLTALMLPSGNDSAYVVASYVVKKTTGNTNIDAVAANNQFAIMMNERAAKIGVKNVNFANPSGYHDDNHYITASGLALITREAMKNPIFLEIVGQSEYTMKYEGKPERTVVWKNRNLLLNKGNISTYYQYATGVKTGNTDEAGECLVATATKDNLKLIAILLKTPVDKRWGESKALFEYGFKNYSLNQFLAVNELVDMIPVDKHSPKGPAGLEVIAKDNYIDLIKRDDIARVERNIVWNETLLEAPVEAGKNVGKAIYSLDGTVLKEVDLVAKNAIEKRTIIEFIFSVSSIPYWIGTIGIVAVIGIIIYIINKRKKRRGFRIKF
ncbi:MAG: hypothetical protein CVU84_15085 [Firmicutes bacterium HGW-Firmicutes-1]|jgi:D-alanyl-D-alanine carboxypeptidase (penicillin-binding protein 5/6)|nr:MAG: hypothetical protein CVU84_15085 [Firmicutes bacterium HGW-Firmicutes-1]